VAAWAVLGSCSPENLNSLKEHPPHGTDLILSCDVDDVAAQQPVQSMAAAGAEHGWVASSLSRLC